MTDLVTEAVIQAALEAWHGGLEHYRDEVKARLDLVAPRIAAQALRQAASTAPFAHREDMNPTGDLPEAVLRRMADELEGNNK